MGVFNRLNFNATLAGDSVSEFPEATKNHMNSIPPQLSDWQKTDFSNSSI